MENMNNDETNHQILLKDIFHLILVLNLKDILHTQPKTNIADPVAVHP